MQHLLKPDDFEPWAGRAVRVAAVPHPIELTLLRIARKPVQPGHEREPFVLYFQSPADIHLLDATYEMDCGKGGPHNIFISQKRPYPDRRIYEAVFS
jgi:hypothetical protein